MEKPIEIMRKFYEDNGRDFMLELQWFLNHGHVCSSPSVFFMFNAVRRDSFELWNTLANDSDTWHIRAAAGAQKHSSLMRVMFRHLPYKLPWLGFGRRFRGNGDIEYYKTERVAALCGLPNF